MPRHTTDEMIAAAFSDCAEAQFAGDARRMRLALLRGECQQCRCLSRHLAREVCEWVQAKVPDVKGFYRVSPDGDIEASEHNPQASGLHLIAWVDAKCTSLAGLSASLESALADGRRNLGCPRANEDCFVLDLNFVDDRDIRQRRGVAAWFGQELSRETLWERPNGELPSQAVAEPGEAAPLAPLSFDPDLVPIGRLIQHALAIERQPPSERAALEAHLTELKVTLIRRLISDHLDYINLAKRWLTVEDLADIQQHRMGFGRIGGKAAGMLLAGRILGQVGDETLARSVRVPESYFLGSDLMVVFMAMNGLTHWNDQKYKSEEQIRTDYPAIRDQFSRGDFPPEILDELSDMLRVIGSRPVIVRSSSQLEDSLGTSFAGKYDSHFCANQAAPQANLKALTRAIALTYASTFKPDPLLYRRSKGLQDYDERMAVLIQAVEGKTWKQAYFPFAAGVAFSRNLYRWAPQIRREAGFVRLVWGLGTRAVERVGNDYPRVVALSHPTLHPDDSPAAIRRYSQQFVDVIDMPSNSLTSVPVRDLLSPDCPNLRYLAQVAEDGGLRPVPGLIRPADQAQLMITFDGLLRATPFPNLMGSLLRTLEASFGLPVDIEFTLDLDPAPGRPVELRLALLQCRPLSQMSSSGHAQLPEDLDPEQIILATDFMVPQGEVTGIRRVVFVDPSAYEALPEASARAAVTAEIARINAALEPKSFICVGPGRWGTTNPDLGVCVDYSDICHAAALVELSGGGAGAEADASLGTHFFQDLMEAEIYPLSLRLDSSGSIFREDFFREFLRDGHAPTGISPQSGSALRVIDVAEYRPSHHLDLVMDSEQGRAVAFLVPDA
jgi:hypothetical protein